MKSQSDDPLGEIVASLPLLLLVGGLSATVFAILAAVGLFVLFFSALFGIPEFKFGEATYDGVWTLLRFGPAALLLGGIAGAIGYGTWTAKGWTRGAVFVFWTFVIVLASGAAMLYPGGGSFWIHVALGGVPLLLVSWLYLCFWGNAVKYYASLKDREADDEPRDSASL